MPLGLRWWWNLKQEVKEIEVIVNNVVFHIPYNGEKYLLFECVKCGSCCKGLLKPLMLTLRDMERISKTLGYDDVGDFLKNECLRLKVEGLGFRWFLKRQSWETVNEVEKQIPCRFLSHDGLCIIYSTRPMVCREFPFKTFFDGMHLHAKFMEAERTIMCMGFRESQTLNVKVLEDWAKILKMAYKEYEETVKH